MKRKLSFERPQMRGGAYTTTPLAASCMAILGSALRSGPVLLSTDEKRALDRLYGFKLEGPNEKPPKPTMPEPPDNEAHFERQKREESFQKALKAWEQWEDPRTLMQAGADRNMARHAEHDGMRLIAWLAKYVPPGEDPLKTLVQLVADAGFNVAPEDIAWAESDDESKLSDAAEPAVETGTE